MGILDGKKGNYLIVCHTYWMNHKQFESKMLVDVTKREAQGEASLMADERRDTFCSADAWVWHIPDTVMVVDYQKGNNK